MKPTTNSWENIFKKRKYIYKRGVLKRITATPQSYDIFSYNYKLSTLEQLTHILKT